MSSEQRLSTLYLQIRGGEEIDADGLDRLTREMKAELEQLDVECVDLMKEESVQKGAKVLDPVTVGGIVLQVFFVSLPEVLEFIRNWLKRSKDREVTIKSQIANRPIEIRFSSKDIDAVEIQKILVMLDKPESKEGN